MKKGLAVTVVVVVVVLAAVLGVAGYCGAFRSVTVADEEFGPVWLVYEKHTGAYGDIRHVIKQVRTQLVEQEGLEPARSFGLYWDDPREVPKEQLRSIGGCILDTSDEETLARILARYNAAEFPRSSVVTATFPLKGPLSFVLAVMKVYPALEAYMAANGLASVPVMEIYDSQSGLIRFVAAHAVSKRRFGSYLGGETQEQAESPEPAEQGAP
jgi:hypothetical protein